jgi:hypothetical protein
MGNVTGYVPPPAYDTPEMARDRQRFDVSETDFALKYGGYASPEQRKNSNLQSYGGSQQAFAEEAQGLRAGAQAARGRGGFALDESQWSAFGGVDDAGRTDQQRGLEMLRNQMDASRQSVGSNAILSGSQAAQGMQASLAGLARGGAVGQMAARDQMQLGNMQMGQAAYGQAGALRAQEAAQASNQYGAAAASVTAADQQRQREAAQWAEAQAASRMTNAKQNAARERGFEGLRSGALSAQQSSAQNQATDFANNEARRWAIAQGDAAAKAAADAAIVGAIGSGAAKAGQMAYDYANRPEEQPTKKPPEGRGY